VVVPVKMVARNIIDSFSVLSLHSEIGWAQEDHLFMRKTRMRVQTEDQHHKQKVVDKHIYFFHSSCFLLLVCGEFVEN